MTSVYDNVIKRTTVEVGKLRFSPNRSNRGFWISGLLDFFAITKIPMLVAQHFKTVSKDCTYFREPLSSSFRCIFVCGRPKGLCALLYVALEKRACEHLEGQLRLRNYKSCKLNMIQSPAWYLLLISGFVSFVFTFRSDPGNWFTPINA